MKALLGGIVGGVASGAAWLAAEHFAQANYFWMVVLVGLVTGLSVHWAGSSSKGWGTARGALALVLTMAVIVGGRQVYVNFMESTIDTKAIAQAIITTEQIPVENLEDEPTESDVTPATPAPTPKVQPRTIGMSGRHEPSIKQHFSEWDMIWMSLAALAAYISGKGGEKSPVVEPVEQPPKDSSVQEGASSENNDE